MFYILCLVILPAGITYYNHKICKQLERIYAQLFQLDNKMNYYILDRDLYILNNISNINDFPNISKIEEQKEYLPLSTSYYLENSSYIDVEDEKNKIYIIL